MSNYLFYYEYNGTEYGVLDQDDKHRRLTVEDLSTGEMMQIKADWLEDKMENMEVEFSLER